MSGRSNRFPRPASPLLTPEAVISYLADHLTIMKHVIYEDPATHRFGLIRLPDRFVVGDKLPILPTDRWFETREEAVAALPELLNNEE